jgi:phosphatidylglycerophosphatase A
MNNLFNLKNSLIKFFATCFGLGYIPFIPGIAGVSFGTFIAYLVNPLIFWQKGLITLILIIIAIPLTTKAEELFQEKDCKKIIIDETIGLLVATIWFSYIPPIIFLLIFFVYGSFDALKIYPANVIERINGGWGIVFDDIVAGVYAFFALVLFTLLI